MPKFITIFSFVLILSFGIIKPLAASRIYDFNNTSDLTTFFNSDGDISFTNNPAGGILLSGYVDVPLGIEDVWTSKDGFSTSGTGDTFEISGFYKIEVNSGYGSIGFTNTDSNSGDGRASPLNGVGVTFHGGGAYFVNNRDYTDFSWDTDLDLGKWYRFRLIAENAGTNKFNLTFIIHEADEFGNIINFKTLENIEVTNAELAGASKLYAYFGAAESRVTAIDNIKIELTAGPTFDDEGKPVVTTTDSSNISLTGSESGGNVTTENGSSVTSKGVCYSTSPNPTTSGTCTSNGTGLGSFTSTITGLSSNTLYYYRAFATNANGTSYGSEKSFTTQNSGANGSSSKRNVFKNSKCLYTTPPKITWMLLKPTIKEGVNGMQLTWTQYGADKVSIFIDNGTGMFPYVIFKTLNDGNEFLANVSSNQKVKILPSNGCKMGKFSEAFSLNSHREGVYNRE